MLLALLPQASQDNQAIFTAKFLTLLRLMGSVARVGVLLQLFQVTKRQRAASLVRPQTLAMMADAQLGQGLHLREEHHYVFIPWIHPKLLVIWSKTAPARRILPLLLTNKLLLLAASDEARSLLLLSK